MTAFIASGRAGGGRHAADACCGSRYRAGLACGLMRGEEPMGLDP
jgi:hypothetical protein